MKNRSQLKWPVPPIGAHQAREAAAQVQRLGGVHAGQRFEVAAPEAVLARGVEATLHHRAAGADAAGLRQEVHLAQLAHIRVAACSGAMPAPPITVPSRSTTK